MERPQISWNSDSLSQPTVWPTVRSNMRSNMRSTLVAGAGSLVIRSGRAFGAFVERVETDLRPNSEAGTLAVPYAKVHDVVKYPMKVGRGA